MFGVGPSRFRTVQDRNLLVDTVAFPAYKRELIERAGPFDEELVRNQDDEYNYRLRERGRRPARRRRKSRYYCRGRSRSLWRQYFQYGFWKVRVMQKHARQMRMRQFAPPSFVALIALSGLFALFSPWKVPFLILVSCYLLANIAAAAAASPSLKLIPFLLVAFAVMHVSYGCGFWLGIFHFRGRGEKSAAESETPDWSEGWSQPFSPHADPDEPRLPPLRVLIVTQFYPPETGAPQNRLSDLAGRLSEFGNDVTVLTAMPNYPTGRVFERYRGQLTLDERRGGVRVLRTWIYVRPGSGFITASSDVLVVRRLLHRVRAEADRRSGRGARRVAASLPGRGGRRLQPGSRCPVRAEHLGSLAGVRRRDGNLETPDPDFPFPLARGRAVPPGGAHLRADPGHRGEHQEPVPEQTGGPHHERRGRGPVLGDLRRPPGDARGVRGGDAFVVGYAGLHGFAQGLDTVLGAADLLRGERGIVFVLVGSGPVRDALIRRQQEQKLENVRFMANQPASRIPAVLASFDAGVIPLKKLDLFRGALPSKLFEAMASGLPLVVSIEGEAKDLVEAAQAGICVEPEEPRAMADAILRLQRDPALRERYSRSGRRYVVENFDRRQIARQVDGLFRGQAVPPPPGALGFRPRGADAPVPFLEQDDPAFVRRG